MYNLTRDRKNLILTVVLLTKLVPTEGALTPHGAARARARIRLDSAERVARSKNAAACALTTAAPLGGASGGGGLVGWLGES